MAPRRNNNNTSHHHSHHQHSNGGGVIGSNSGGLNNTNDSSSSSNGIITTSTSLNLGSSGNNNNNNSILGPITDLQNLLGLDHHHNQLQHLTNQIADDQLNNNLTVLTNSFNFDFQNLQNMTSTNLNHNHINNNEILQKCCVPIGECFKLNNNTDCGIINYDDLNDCIRVICSNENCTAGQYMHRECFEAWEQNVLITLKSIGRARSWSDRQRQQNLWTKKGYDLVYKACNCKCGRGHLKKDLDWLPSLSSPTINNNNNNINYNMNGRNSLNDDDANKKKKKRNRNNQKPILALTNVHSNTNSNMNNNGYHINNKTLNGNQNNGNIIIEHLRGRTGSLSSSNGSTSPPVSGSSEQSLSPIHNGNNNLILIGNNHKSIIPTQQQQQLLLSPQQQQQSIYQQPNHQLNVQQLLKTKVEIYSERVRSTSGCNGIFSRRLDFSSFNQLPKTRLNSYQVKMEDEGNHGNDETRLFILSSLAQSQKSRVNCILCEDAMLVFDRYPLVDGSFFLSPRQHSPDCIEVKYENKILYLTAVCMGCVDGNSSTRAIGCRFCGQRWDGSSLVLGTMYSYDIFAAMPCCIERLKCNTCFKMLLHPEQRLNFYSDYSHSVTCPYCATLDTHFVKPLAHCYTKLSIKAGIQLP